MDEIIQGSTYGVLFEFTKPDGDNPNVSVAANPSAATVEVVRARTGERLTLDSNTATLDGNIATFTVPASKLNRVGNYSIYMTATFSDESTSTQSRPFRVLARDGSN